MEKYLIINADDFGICRAHNAATAELFKFLGIKLIGYRELGDIAKES